jgi:putative CocE/NonD family hydrolase
MNTNEEYKVIRDVDVMIPMRDGVNLAADIYKPDGPGKFPVLINRGPYGKNSYASDPDHSLWFFPKHGYVVISQDCRGRFDSEGDLYNPLFQEINDGYDTIEWASRQEWSNGNVGTTGQSYLGATQYALACNPLSHPNLKCMAPVSASSDFRESWVYHTGGPLEWGWLVPYAIHKGFDTLERLGKSDLVPEFEEYLLETTNFARPLKDEWYNHLPLIDWIDKLKEVAPYLQEYFDNENDNPYWWDINLNKKSQNVKVPMLHVGGWYDIFLEGCLNGFQSISCDGGNSLARNNQRLIVGPWAHIRPFTQATTKGAGDIDFGANSPIELHEYLLNWFDYWLKNKDTGIQKTSPVLIFVMGKNEWRPENEWPLARTQYTNFYFHSLGKANSRHGDGILNTLSPYDETDDSYIYDPRSPVPTRGGNTLIISHGVADQRPLEEREDILVYTTEPLERELELTGPIKVKLFASSTACDTDFTAKLIDVHPSGYSQNLQDGIIRARFRTSRKTPTYITPNTIYEYTIDLWSTSHAIMPGHSIRVEISSSNFPRFDRNPNTGSKLGSDTQLLSAKQTIFHSAKYPSHITLPIIPS